MHATVTTGHDSLDCRKISAILARVGEKWTILIVTQLRGGPRRFNEIKRLTGGISQQMLTRTLKGLERDGMVTRTVHPTVPPQVEYALTDLGHSLSVPVNALGDWALANMQQIEAARVDYDDRFPDRPISVETPVRHARPNDR